MSAVPELACQDIAGIDPCVILSEDVLGRKEHVVAIDPRQIESARFPHFSFVVKSGLWHRYDAALS